MFQNLGEVKSKQNLKYVSNNCIIVYKNTNSFHIDLLNHEITTLKNVYQDTGVNSYDRRERKY